MKNQRILGLFLLALVLACNEVQELGDPLEHALNSENVLIKQVVDSLEQYEVQIRFTQIERKNGKIAFKDFDFQVDQENYFYPASTVKFPIAVLALEKLNSLDTLSRDTKFFVEGDSLETTFAQEVVKIFAVSDNDANNRLVEFLGQDAINARLNERGVHPVRISHRLGYHSDDLSTKPLIVYINDSTTATSDPIQNTEAKPLQIKRLLKGKGFYSGDSLYSEPFNFSLKNHYPITAQHGMLKRVIFPEFFEEKERFALSQDQYEFLRNAMQVLPKDAGYDPMEYYDSYGKFFMYGDSESAMPGHVKIFNKVGYAYGTLTDCAYIIDGKNGVEFLLTATILVNQDGIFNDDVYEYETIGIPFLAQLGRELYEYELKRKKNNHGKT